VGFLSYSLQIIWYARSEAWLKAYRFPTPFGLQFGLLRYCTLFALISVIMSGALIFRAQYLAPWHWRDWFS
jgi:hypothetical protein